MTHDVADHTEVTKITRHCGWSKCGEFARKTVVDIMEWKYRRNNFIQHKNVIPVRQFMRSKIDCVCLRGIASVCFYSPYTGTTAPIHGIKSRNENRSDIHIPHDVLNYTEISRIRINWINWSIDNTAFLRVNEDCTLGFETELSQSKVNILTM